MGIEITVHDNLTEAIARKLAAASTKAEQVVAVQIAKDTEPFVPAQTKSLVNRTQVSGGTIIYPGPYARYLYYGKLMVDPETGSAWARKGATKVLTGTDLNIKTNVHGLAQSHWFEASKAMNKDKWVKIAKKAVVKYLK